MPDLKQIALSVAQDLMTLEVNTVLKPGMTARKPPQYPLLLGEIAEKYVAALVQFDAGTGPVPDGAGADTVHIDAVLPEAGPGAATGNAIPTEPAAPAETGTAIGRALALMAQTFPGLAAPYGRLADAIGELHPPADARFEQAAPPFDAHYAGALLWATLFGACADVAATLLAATPADSPARAPLRRIARESRWVQAFIGWQHIASPRGLDLQPEDRMRLRKLWDLGGECVVMQTTIHLDGDVLNGIDPTILGHPRFEALRAIHADGVGTALGHWRALFETVCTAFGKLSDAFANVIRQRD